MSLQGDVSEGICIYITLRSMTIRYVRLVTYSSRKRNSIKKSQLDRIENGHRRGPATGLSQSLGIIIKKKKNSASYLRAAYRSNISRMEGS